MEAQEYLVNGITKVKRYIDKEIGVDYEATRDEDNKEAGSITVFDITYNEHMALREYITTYDMWSE